MVRTRFAPSPTGKLHIGTARAALFNYLFTKKQKGKFLLRIEDTDKERSKKEFEDDIIESLRWLGLSWDEFYRQSYRIKLYEKHLIKLLKEGSAFYCDHSSQQTQGKVHFCGQRDTGQKRQAAKDKGQNLKGIIRFKTPQDRVIRFDDIIRGRVEFQTNEIGDFSIAKNLEEPLFNFANAVDDYEMQISHVIRAEDHLSNTPKQILLQEALAIPSPIYAHLPLILGKDRSKLSKRHGAVSLSEYRMSGYLAQAVVNFIAFLGWNPGDQREFFSLEELIKEFSLERVKKGGSIFNIDRLNFVNRYYIKRLSLDEITKASLPFFKERFGDKVIKYDFNKFKNIVQLERDKVRVLADFPKHLDFFFQGIHYQPELLVWRDMSFTRLKESLETSLQIIEKIHEESYNENTLRQALLEAAEELGDRGRLLWPLRVALSGKKASASPFDIAALLGKKETLRRVSYAIKKITQPTKGKLNR